MKKKDEINYQKQELSRFYKRMFLKYAKKIKIRFELITPQKAVEYYKKNTNNYRPKVNKNYVHLVRDILKFHWTITGETIVIDELGILIDGQHRLEAIIKQGIALPCIVVEGVPKEAKDMTGNAVPRKLWNRLQNHGEKYPQRLQEVLNLAYDLDQDTYKHARPTHAEAFDYLNDHPEIRDCVKKYSKVPVTSPISASVATYCYYILSKVDVVKSEKFIDRVITARDIKKQMRQIICLREFILDTRKRKAFIRRKTMISYVIKAWNATRRSQKITEELLSKDCVIPKPI